MRGILRKYIRNRGFFLSFAVILGCYLACSVYEWLRALQEPVLEYRPNALMLSSEANFFGGIILVFPFCACLPIASSMRKKIRLVPSDFATKRTALQEAIGCFTAGALCVSLPFILHAVAWSFIALPANPMKYSSHEIYFSGLYSVWYQTFYGLPMYISIAIGMALSGGALATIYYSASKWIHNWIASLAYPASIYFVWIKAGITFPKIIRATPDALFNDALQVGDIAFTLMMYSILVLGHYIIHTRMCKNGGTKHE